MQKKPEKGSHYQSNNMKFITSAWDPHSSSALSVTAKNVIGDN